MSKAIAGIHIDLTANTAKFQKGLKDAANESKSFGEKFTKWVGTTTKGVGGVLAGATKSVISMRTAIIGAVAAMGTAKAFSIITETAEHVDKIGKAALRLGMSVEELSALDYAAGQSGIEFENLAQAAGKAAKNVAEMVANGTTVAKVGRMNVNLTDTFGRVRGIAQLLPDLAAGIQSASSEAEQLRLSQKFFGKAGGDQFVTWLKESGKFTKGLAEQFAYAQRLGAIFTEDQFIKLRALGDSVGNLGKAWMGVKVKLVTEIAPAMTQVIDSLALQLADLPHLVRASVAAFSTMGTGTPEQKRAAAQALVDMKNATLDLLRTGAIELGRLSGNALVEALSLGLRALAPVISDIFRDALGPVFNAIPGVNIAKSTRGQLADLKTAYAEVERLKAEIARAQDNIDNNPYLDGIDRSREQSNLSGMQAQLARMGEQPLLNRIAVQASMVRHEDAERMRQLGEAFKEFGSGMGFAADEFTKKLEPKIDAMQKARDGLLTFAPADAVAITPKQTAIDVFRVFDQIVERSKTTGEEIAAGLGKGWEKYTKRVKEQWKEHVKATKEIFEKADAIRFELYPKEKFDNDVRELKALKKALDAVGAGSKLPQEAVDAKIAAMNKELEESLKKLAETEDAMKDTFGGEVRDKIKGFASNIGDTFADLALDGKASFEDLAKSFTKMLTSMFATKLLFEPLLGMIGTSVGGWVNTQTGGGANPMPPSSFIGPPATAGGLSMGMVGGVTVNVIDRRSGGSPVEVSERNGADGRTIDVLIKDSVKKLLRTGELDKDMRVAYGATRTGRV